MNEFFFDSHGGLWVTCTGDHSQAVAFGPTGIAREATAGEVKNRLGESEGTPYARAKAQGKVRDEEDGWSFLV